MSRTRTTTPRPMTTTETQHIDDLRDAAELCGHAVAELERESAHHAVDPDHAAEIDAGAARMRALGARLLKAAEAAATDISADAHKAEMATLRFGWAALLEGTPRHHGSCLSEEHCGVGRPPCWNARRHRDHADYLAERSKRMDRA